MPGCNSCKQYQQKEYVQTNTCRQDMQLRQQAVLLSWLQRELESSLNPQKQRSCSLGTVLTGQGHGSERRKQLNKEAAVEGFLWVWSRRAVSTWQPAGYMQHNTGNAGLAVCSRPLWPQDSRDSTFPVQSLMAQNHFKPSKMCKTSNFPTLLSGRTDIQGMPSLCMLLNIPSMDRHQPREKPDIALQSPHPSSVMPPLSGISSHDKAKTLREHPGCTATTPG